MGRMMHSQSMLSTALVNQVHRYLSFSRWIVFACFTVLLGACAFFEKSQAVDQAGDRITLHVFAAASLTEAFAEIERQYENIHPDVNLVFSFAGSQQLAQQIAEGAPVDVFASANHKQMDVAVATGRIVPGAVTIFARNELVVALPAGNPAELGSLQDLSRPGLRLVFGASEVPVGQYALEFLEKAAADPEFPPGFKESVLSNVVSYEENVKVLVAKVSLGEADAGIAYTSDVLGGSTSVDQISIPAELNITAEYPIAPLLDSPHLVAAEAFVAYLVGNEGQDVLEAMGFLAVRP